MIDKSVACNLACASCIRRSRMGSLTTSGAKQGDAMATSSKWILLVFTFAGTLVLPVAADAGPFDRKDGGGMDPSLSPAAREKKDARIQASIRGSGSLAGVPRANGRVWGQVDFEDNGKTVLLPGMGSDGSMTGPPRNREQISHGRFGAPSGNSTPRLGVNSVPRVGNPSTPHVHTSTPQVHSHTATGH
jgi:hypothetical protein